MAQLAAVNRSNLNDFQQSISQQQFQQQRSLSNTSANQESSKKHNNFGRSVKCKEVLTGTSSKIASRSSTSSPASKMMALSNDINSNNFSAGAVKKDPTPLKEDPQQIEKTMDYLKDEANNLVADSTNNVDFLILNV